MRILLKSAVLCCPICNVYHGYIYLSEVTRRGKAMPGSLVNGPGKWRPSAWLSSWVKWFRGKCCLSRTWTEPNWSGPLRSNHNNVSSKQPPNTHTHMHKTYPLENLIDNGYSSPSTNDDNVFFKQEAFMRWEDFQDALLLTTSLFFPSHCHLYSLIVAPPSSTLVDPLTILAFSSTLPPTPTALQCQASQPQQPLLLPPPTSPPNW